MHDAADVTFRALTLTNADRFAALVRSAFANLPIEPPPSAARLTGGDVRAHLLAGGGGTVAGAMEAGLLWAEKDGGLYVSRIAVRADWRRQGLARRLLAMAEAEARQRGLARVWLSTRLALTANRRLFARCGFVDGASHSHSGYSVPTFIDMHRLLAK